MATTESIQRICRAQCQRLNNICIGMVHFLASFLLCDDVTLLVSLFPENGMRFCKNFQERRVLPHDFTDNRHGVLACLRVLAAKYEIPCCRHCWQTILKRHRPMPHSFPRQDWCSHLHRLSVICVPEAMQLHLYSMFVVLLLVVCICLSLRKNWNSVAAEQHPFLTTTKRSGYARGKHGVLFPAPNAQLEIL